MASSSVPLMMDVEGMAESGAAEEESGASGMKNQFEYNNNVLGASKAVRLGFMRKVYGLLAVQLIMTTVIAGALLLTPGVKEMVQTNSWMLMPAFVLTFGLLMALHVKRKEHPVNLILLAAFTVIEAYTVGVVVTFFDKFVVLQAFFLTSGVVAGLTAFTFQTKRDFSSMGATLYSGLLILIGASFIHMFVGGEVTQLVMAVGGALLFSLFIVFDTQMIMSRVSEEEYILATIQLYLDIINLFLEILKILNKANNR
eukprot:TRINITY_DN30586_c0_g1_i1.p1 TRINITY_DN30586_c0_g1~~TRINITY_DN30586_c0_g1_i1.p1  ORF type:complete len:256 (+),score=78.60 TRINITY_DN30586_c0_g1_i1:47-814(+)